VFHPFTNERSCVDGHLCRSRRTEEKKARYDNQEEATTLLSKLAWEGG
jgi:hypothetical protein